MRRLTVLSFLLLCLGVGFAPPAAAKSFQVTAVQIEATLMPDSSMRVVEHITYDFSGEFHNGTRPIPPGDYEITDMSVSEGGRRLPFTGAPHDLAWRYDAVDEQRTFDISYTVRGAATVGTDVAELYWKWLGVDHPGVGRLRVALEVPGQAEGVRAWAHGPLNGLVELRGTTVLFSVDGVPPSTFVEGRVAVPAGAFTVAPSGGDRLPAILAEEQGLADAANEQRARAQQREAIERFLLRWWFVPPVLGWIVFLACWLKWGREHTAAVDVGQYHRELPEDPPAFAPVLRSFGTVDPSTISVTLVDLAQRGYLTIEELPEERRFRADKMDWRFTWKEQSAPLRAFEYTLLETLFARGPSITQEGLMTWARSNRTESQRWVERIKQQVRADFKAARYVEGGKGPAYALNVLAAIAVVGLSLAAVTRGQVLGLVGAASGSIQILATVSLRRRTQLGAQRAAELDALERFLRDFSQLEDAPVGHLILWERYLVYAVALGVADEVARALAMRLPVEVGAPGQGFAPWYISSSSHGSGVDRIGGLGSLNSFAGGFGPDLVAAATPPSSSSSGGGGGGGFSGGGGGGGGGGGIGAS
ncbi:MAG: hypothetical protein AVDCRST_MAG50-3144 [uncultured Acidimicrobiales bacterium]|uniref:DUF2207 domain-containing protein n=1 Tax=uncultured Acidimicrobiales bacterium TaxID=310071 RepID=A0A6J4J0Z0_9ACTN|nr:MAG: hypothetical protein AVDCRST_MAG50-3144 [uncultured Acidimicrobiales bacterium]